MGEGGATPSPGEPDPGGGPSIGRRFYFFFPLCLPKGPLFSDRSFGRWNRFCVGGDFFRPVFCFGSHLWICIVSLNFEIAFIALGCIVFVLLWRTTLADLFLERDAVISECGKYRYLLRRTWDHAQPRCLYVMLNPSTADAEIDDATIRSCIRLAKGMGYGSFEVINLYGLRSTDPAELAKADDPIGPRNADVGDAAISRCDIVICAWGAHPMAEKRAHTMKVWVRGWKPAAYCFGTTKSGAPKHPLYIKSGTPLQAY